MIRQSLIASFLALSLTLAPMQGAHAEDDTAAPGIYFYPAKTWTVEASPVTMAGTTTRKCMIANEFNNGFVVQLNGGHKWVETLQIDFRQNSFDPGERYDVALTVPGIKNKTLAGQAAQPSLLVINMAGQKDFYQAMRDSSVFDLKIDENEFRFYMVGFANNAEAFERCMAGGGIAPPSPDQLRDASAPTVNEAIAYEQAEMSGVKLNEILPSDPRPTVGDMPDPVLDTAPAATKPVEQTPRPQRKRLSQMLAEEIKRNPEIAALESDRPVPVPPVEKLSAPSTDSFTPPPAPEAKADARSPLAMPPGFATRPELPAPDGEQTASADSLATEIDVQMVDLKRPQPDPEALLAREEGTRISTSTEIKVTKQTGKIEADFSNDYAGLDAVEPASAPRSSISDSGMGAKIAELQHTVRALETENLALNDELKAALNESKQERMSVSSENWNLEKAAKRYNEAERQLKRLGQQLQEERAACTVEKQELETLLFDPTLTDEAQLAKLAQLRRELDQAKQTIRLLKASQ